MIKLLFFGQLKEQLGVASTEFKASTEITVAQLLQALIQANPQWEQDLNNDSILVAVDQMMAKPDTLVSMSSEVAFFPPVTGG
ncbi:MAG: molybdopterin converting factor subunit 1 [Gammaproteobacteria bacterium]|nr:molybdopterin converting factor subunit 1 [Gammaproteobacteria bacterium]